MDSTTSAEHEIYTLRHKGNLALLAGNTDDYNRIQLAIAALQKTTGAVIGAERKPNAHGDNSGSQHGK